ncbi:hypothetical protein PAF17_10555 [Paracoccus sp. Z330]|uniref:DUF2163 domain-containing protein n=1 Tax=Paracoccus onchidii TaxID=3017813 RepID=A0ABT4ZEY9_9RHOB|nr:hypothetical protein [Paracoccus onchidii]MDB6177941.1 hypothetical protein [Paracoccus onchidii]
MKILEPSLISSLQAARDEGIAPVYFAWIEGRSRDTGTVEGLGFWSGDDDHSFNVQTPSGGLTSRAYIGGCNLTISDPTYVADWTDNPISIGLSQIADAAQYLARGLDLRLAYVETHVTTWDSGRLSSNPQLHWIGIVDDAQISTPSAGGDGGINLTVRSELLSQMSTVNPAKSSDAHQKRRSSGDLFSVYSGMIRSRKTQWWNE